MREEQTFALAMTGAADQGWAAAGEPLDVFDAKGALDAVLHDLGVRSGVDDLRALAAILIQADRFGSSIAQALRVQSDTMRVKRSQLAEERAQKTAVKLIFPLVLFIFPGIFVVLVGPAAISMINNLLTVR